MRTAVLLSGGMDSIAITYWKRPDAAITIDYGQLPAAGELRAAESVTLELDISQHIIRTDLSILGSGDMAGTPSLGVAPMPEWWPFRNQLLITLAAMQAIKLDVQRLLIGTLKTDEGHADGRPEFIRAMDNAMALQEGALSIEAPAIAMTSVSLIRASKVPPELIAWAHSCHVSEYACGVCRGCRKHYETLAALGVDPY